MFFLKFNIQLRRTVSVVMITAVIQAGLLSSAVPVLAQLEETTSGAVYESNLSPPGVGDAVYNVPESKPDMPPPLNFLRDKLLDQLTAHVGTFTVSGQVIENSTGMPLPGVAVQMLIDGHLTQFKASTDDKGSYSLTGVGPGKYQLAFETPGYAPENFGVNISEADVRQDCGLFRNTSFKGQVVNKEGDSIEAVEVSLTDENLPDRGIRLLTNENGLFNIIDVPPGRYRLSVSQSVYHRQKTVWVDEYPQELTMVLPVSVSEAVYRDILALDKNDHKDPTVDEEVYSDSSNVEEESNEQPIEGVAEQGRISPSNISPVGFNIVSFSTGSKKEPWKPNLSWYPEFHALKGPAPLAELEQLLKQQATMD